MCDIQAMFHQVKVDSTSETISDSCGGTMKTLREIQWNSGWPSIFSVPPLRLAARTSPWKTVADQYEEACGSEAADVVRRNFYVDDGLKSVATTEQAKDLIRKNNVAV